MALDSRYIPQAIFIEVFEKNSPEGPQYVTRRDDVTYLTDAKRNELGRALAANVDREFYDVRLARYTIEVMQKF